MSFSSEVREELLNLKIWDVNSKIGQKEQIDRVHIREAFIKSGFITDPNKDYHLEILFKQKKKAEEIQILLLNFGINSKTIKKDAAIMLYIKEAELISAFLALIGANKAVIKFEEIRVLKDTRNTINRLVNCETANLNKTIDAAVKQIEEIKYLKSKNKFNELPENLKEIANLRIENSDLSYEELGRMLKVPIGKSGVKHRLDKISNIVKSLE